MLIIDSREVKLIDLIKSKSPTEFKIPYSTENLQIGDIIIKHTLDNIKYSLIIERKCVTDMIASIKDGRYKEQKIRLLAELANSPNTIITYLIEGSTNEICLPQDKIMFNGSIISSTFRDKISIIRTYSLAETIEILIRLHERFTKDITDFFTPKKNYTQSLEQLLDQTNQDNQVNELIQTTQEQEQDKSVSEGVNSLYLQSIKKCKKDNITPITWNHMCYMNIPGISSNIAIKIAYVYPKLKDLILAYQMLNSETEKENLLANIILTDTDKQKRRIGSVISKRVYQYIL
jgi:crossover junction endonuclease MUS81